MRMPPFLDLRISDSALTQLRVFLREKEPGSVPLLLMPVVGIERKRIVQIGFYPPSVLDEMVAEYASWGANLVQDCHGTHMAILDGDMLEELSRKLLVYAGGEFALASN